MYMKQKYRDKINQNRTLHFLAYFIKNIEEFLLFIHYRDNKQKISDLKNVKENKECFIVGNGPSLLVEDLELIKKNNIDSFACNKIYKIYEKTGWRPRYYVAQDCYVNDLEGVKKSEAEYVFLSSELYKKIKPVMDNIYLFRSVRMDAVLNKRIINNIEKGAKSYGSVLHAAIQIAIYMGYSTIYLIGVDHNYPVVYDENWNIVNCNCEKAHFYSQQNASLANIELMTKGFAYLKDFAESEGVKIYNATRGGRLEVFERCDIEEWIMIRR